MAADIPVYLGQRREIWTCKHAVGYPTVPYDFDVTVFVLCPGCTVMLEAGAQVKKQHAAGAGR